MTKHAALPTMAAGDFDYDADDANVYDNDSTLLDQMPWNSLMPRLMLGYSGVVSVMDKNWSVTNDGTGDNASALTSIFDYAENNRKVVYFPPGIYAIKSSVAVKAPFYGAGGPIPGSSGSGTQFGTVIKNTATTGSIFNGGAAMFQLDTTDADVLEFYRWMWLRDICFDGNGNDCIGYKGYGVINVGSMSRYRMDNVLARNCTTGIHIYGFTGTINNCYTLSCDNGLIVSLANAVSINGGWYAVNTDGWAIKVLADDASSTPRIDNISLRGVTIQTDARANGVRICERVRRVTIDTCYFEGHYASGDANQTYHLEVGVRNGTDTAGSTNSSDNKVVGITLINNAFKQGALTYEGDEGGPDIIFNNVRDINWVGTNSVQLRNINYTENVVNINGALLGGSVSSISASGQTLYHYERSGYITDASGFAGRPNLSLIANPNGYIDGSGSTSGLRGYREVSFTNVSVSEETTITRDGRSSTKISRASGGAVNNFAAAYPYGSESLVNRGHPIVFSGFIYIESAGSPGNGYDTYDTWPSVGFIYKQGGGSFAFVLPITFQAGTPLKTARYYQVNTWRQFIVWWTPSQVSPEITDVGWLVRPVQTSYAPSQTHNVYLSDLFFGTAGSYADVISGRWRIDGSCGMFLGDKFMVQGDLPSGTNIRIMEGDTYYYPQSYYTASPKPSPAKQGKFCSISGTAAAATMVEF